MTPALAQFMPGAAGRSAARAGAARLAAEPRQLWLATEVFFYLFLVATVFETIPLFSAQERADGSIVSMSRLLGYGLVLLGALNYRACFSKAPLPFWFFLGYYALGTISTLLHSELLDNLGEALRFWQLPVLFLLSCNLFRHPQVLRRSLIVLAVAGGLLATWAVLGDVTVDIAELSNQPKGDQRLSIVGEDPNFIAVSLGIYLLVIAAIAGGLFQLPWGWRVAIAPLAAPVLLIIVRTGSRSALAGIAVGLLALLLGSGLKWRTLLLTAVVGALGLASVRLCLDSGVVTERILRSWHEGETAGRTEIYKASLELLREKPLLGHGLMSSQYALGPLLNRTVRDPHNILLGASLDAGLSGGLLYATGFALCCWAGFKKQRLDYGLLLLALLLATATFGMTLNLNSRKLYWVLLAAATAPLATQVGSGLAQGLLRNRAQVPPTPAKP